MNGSIISWNKKQEIIKIPFGKRLVTVLDDTTPREDDGQATIR